MKAGKHISTNFCVLKQFLSAYFIRLQDKLVSPKVFIANTTSDAVIETANIATKDGNARSGKK